MRFSNVAIPLGLAWSSPFCRWQGPLAEMSSVDLAVDVTTRVLRSRGIAADDITHYVLGTTVPQLTSFYGVTTITRRLGAPDATGPTIAQACATSAACVQAAAAEVELGAHEITLALTTDRTSNGPTLLFPTPSGRGGAPATEHWVNDPMTRDPTTGESMLDTAENVAAEGGFTREEIDEVALLRYEQYESVTERPFLVPAHVPGRKGAVTIVEADSGIHPTTAEGLAKLAPVKPGGVITYGTQTHPADGAAAMVLATTEQAWELSGGRGIARVRSTAFARVEPARMPKAPVSAALAALADAGIGIADIDIVTTHNPFAVNDLWFTRQTGFPLERMNPYGCSLVYGHPQGPTGARAITELVTALEARGGGRGLFTGCAAGDTAGAVVVEV
ncbi:MAG TPA: thiolase family protein [Streptosporangiaceae bacterium]|jgi:acetyl-CoA acetyltransferase family protein